MEKEIVICAAVCVEGRVFIGHRHGQALQVMRDILGWEMSGKEMTHYLADKDVEQGFVTSRNRFVGREEGRKIQDAAGIPSADKDGYRANTLFSEDLY